jgi:16S rRNA (guanine966-N2)-methyltransferase
VRVIAGHFGGRRLVAPAGRRTRPTSDRVREALFSMLEPVVDARVLDLFAGTGALAIEALSRGAREALLIDSDTRAIAAINRNLEALGITDQQAQVHQSEVMGALDAARRAHQSYDLIFIDPPYRQAGQYAPRLQAALEPLLADSARVVLESDRRRPLRLQLPLQRERRYGDTVITIHSHT